MLVYKIKKMITDPKARFTYLNAKGFYRNISDEEFIKKAYKANFGKKIDLNSPQTFSEKLQWLKLNDRKAIYSMMVDKCRVKKYVADIIGEQYIIPTIDEWESPDDIDFNALPEKFVLKCNHNSGTGMCICKDKSQIDIETVKQNLKTGLEQDYYIYNREWPYKDIKKMILAEQYMEDMSDTNSVIEGLTDYKFYCFNGEPKFLYVAKANFQNGIKHDLLEHYDLEWNLTPFQRTDHDRLPFKVEKPKDFDLMIEFSKKLSKSIPFIRVDWYEINGHLYFGELTLYPGSGFVTFSPDCWNKELGSWIDISK